MLWGEEEKAGVICYVFQAALLHLYVCSQFGAFLAKGTRKTLVGSWTEQEPAGLCCCYYCLCVCSCFLFSSDVRVDLGIIPLCVFDSRKRFVHYSHSYFRRNQSKWWETMAKGTSVAKACKSNLIWDRRVAALSSLCSRLSMCEGGDWWWSQPYCTFISDAVL